jgi:hypothetical protein
MTHTYTVIKHTTNAIFNHLDWESAKSIANAGDMLLTIKDNHVSAMRSVIEEDLYGDMVKEFNHIEGPITPFYQ